MRRLFQLILALALTASRPLYAQEGGPAPAAAAGVVPAGLVPRAPATVVRDPAGRAGIRAVRIAEAVRVDGRLDEAFYAQVRPISDFVQVEPAQGSPATEKTEVWITFDNRNVYVSFRCWDSEPNRRIAKELRRDNASIWNGDDNIAFIFDTFFDHRNGFQFTLNSIGGRQDAQTVNERQWNGDWNTIWDFAVGRFEGGWTVETAIPFKSLRYGADGDQVWGFNAFRTNRWKNELSFLTPTPRARGQQGLLQTSVAAPMVGLQTPIGARNIEIKPYAISNASASRTATTPTRRKLTGDLGIDAKYGITQNLVADVTVNTDFAQVEADQQQVNLTRFSLFFPEKREFFLENQGTFQFGSSTAPGGDVPVMFYSRRIGIEGGGVVPIDGGGRVSGRVGRYSVGLIDINTHDEQSLRVPSANFSVARIKRDILRRSAIGAIYTGRSDAPGGVGGNVAYGVDGTFAFFSNLNINSYWAKVDSTAKNEGNTSYRAQLDYAGDRYGLQLDRMVVGQTFNPGVGFVRRPDMRRWLGEARFSPRPKNNRVVRKYSYTAGYTQIEDHLGRLQNRDRSLSFETEFQNADRLSANYTNAFEFLPAPFTIAPGVRLPVAGYDTDNLRLTYTRAIRHQVAGTTTVERGTFYSGTKSSVGFTGGRVNVNARFSVEPSYTVNWIDLVQGAFTTHLLGSRITFTPTARSFFSTFLQYNSSNNTVAVNSRVRWEYRPGSELFVVFNEDRDTRATGFPRLNNRAFIVKVNRLIRF